MESYIVSARKYRPSTFKSVVGQHALVNTLKNAVKSGRLAHSYLFCGQRGVGKTTMARIFAKAINCEHLTADGEPCNECESCRAFNEQRSLNIIELDAASNNSVDDIRQLTDQVLVPPVTGRYRVFIVDEVHMLSAAAFNAFLKTLEEPPKYVIFILATTERQKILPTILSRCQKYDFQRITPSDIAEQLKYVADHEGYTTEPEALNVIAQKADGATRWQPHRWATSPIVPPSTISTSLTTTIISVLSTLLPTTMSSSRSSSTKTCATTVLTRGCLSTVLRASVSVSAIPVRSRS